MIDSYLYKICININYLFIILMGSYMYIEFTKNLLFYYFIDLCQILNLSKLGSKKFINLYRLLIYRDY